MSGYGFHWTPCPGGGRGGIIAGVVLGLAGYEVLTSQAVTDAVATAVEVAVIAIVALVVLAIVAAVAVWQVRRRRARPARPLLLTAVREPGDSRQVAAGTGPRYDAPALPRADVSAYPRIHAQPHVVTSRALRPRCAGRDGRRSLWRGATSARIRAARRRAARRRLTSTRARCGAAGG